MRKKIVMPEKSQNLIQWATKCLFIGQFDNTTAYLLQNKELDKSFYLETLGSMKKLYQVFEMKPKIWKTAFYN